MTKSPVEERKEERKERKVERRPLGGLSLKLDGVIPKGYVGRWINDDGSRLQDALAAGYFFARKDEMKFDKRNEKHFTKGSGLSKPVGTKDSGEPMKAYLMLIRKEFSDQDRAAKKAKIQVIEDAILGGDIGNTSDGGRYKPKAADGSPGIKIDNAGFTP